MRVNLKKSRKKFISVTALYTEFLTLKFVLINEGESDRKLPKVFAGKNVRMKQKKFTL